MSRLLITILGLAFFSSLCPAKDIYVTQNASGGNSGADCLNAHSAAWFNTASNWGSGPSQISPGDTVHLCGIFTGTGGANMLTVRAGGSPGSPIRILFEPGAQLLAPYWNGTTGAISCTNLDYLIIDGGSSGLIRATANGTTLSFQQDSAGVSLNGCSNVEVRNLTIANMYIRTPNTNDGCNCGTGVAVSGGSHVYVHGNTIHDAQYGIFYGYESTPTLDARIYSNTVYHTATGIVFGDLGPNASASGVLIHDNEIYDAYFWDSPANLFHCDGMHLWATNSGANVTGMQIYNNFIHGTMGGHTSGWIFPSGGINGVLVYNNLLQADSGGPTDGFLFFYTANNFKAYNNTIIGATEANGIAVEVGSSGGTIENNIITNTNVGIYIDTSSNISNSDYNAFNLPTNRMVYHDGFLTFSQWKTTTGFDSHSLGPSPNLALDSTYHLLAGSAAIGAGINLYSVFQTDKAGNPRPSTGPWDLGAYVFSSAPRPNPPTNLSVIQIK